MSVACFTSGLWVCLVILADMSEPVVHRLRPDADDDGIFLVHPAGGSIFGYRAFARHSRFRGALNALAFPNELAAARPDVPELAAYYVDEVRKVQPHGPYLLGGYSFGGTVAFEMTRQLEAGGEDVRRLIMFDALPPESYVDCLRAEEDVLRAAPLLLRTLIPRTLEEGEGEQPPKTVDEAIEKVAPPHWTPMAIAAYRQFLVNWMVHCAALADYRPPGRIHTDVTLFTASEPRPELFGRMRVGRMPMRGWQAHIDGALETAALPGDHYTMFGDHMRTLARAADEVLQRYESASTIRWR